MPFAQPVEYVFGLFDLFPRTFARIDIWDVDDGLLGRVENLEDVVGVWTGIEGICSAKYAGTESEARRARLFRRWLPSRGGEAGDLSSGGGIDTEQDVFEI